MENLTHSLVGATLAELALPATVRPGQRRLFFIAGIVAANLPDADLLYTRITAAPVGYLLHHRGHTHTLAGLAAQAALATLVALLPPVRRRIGSSAPRFALLVAAGLLSHLLLDSWNSYGVHPFWPIDNRWLYGDAIYIVEPWLWLLLGIPVVMNAHGARARTVTGTSLAALATAGAWFGLIGTPSFVALAVAAAGATVALARLGPRARSAAALVATSVFVTGMFLARDVVARRARATLPRTPGATVLDVVLNPQPANPLCWNALAIVKREREGDYVTARASVPLGQAVRCGGDARGRVEWARPVSHSLATLRGLVRDDCRVRAWMQFGRVPEVGDGQIADMRFGGPARGNFSAMPFGPGTGACPAHLTPWDMPRADLLD